MLIRAGFEITIHNDTEIALLCALSPHSSQPRPILGDAEVHLVPPIPAEQYRDTFGNEITRLTAPAGKTTLVSDFVMHDSGEYDPVQPDAEQHPVGDLPEEALEYLIASRFCESDLLAADAWALFGNTEPGWARAQAICDYVHNHITFGYQYGRSTKTALDAWREGNGVCRDYAHLAIALTRAMNIPARYASGYLGDIGVPYGGPMDFCAWYEVYLGGRWYTFDARYNTPRIGRILMVRGRDAADVSMIMSFGAHRLEGFNVWCEELPADLALTDIEPQLRLPHKAAA